MGTQANPGDSFRKEKKAEDWWYECRTPEECWDLQKELARMIKEITRDSELYWAETENGEISNAYVHWRGPGYYARKPWRVEEGIIRMEITQIGQSRENYQKALEAAREQGLSDLRWADTPEEAAWPYKIKRRCPTIFGVCPELDPDNWPDHETMQ